MLRLLFSFTLLLSLFAFAAAQSDEATLRAIVIEYYDAYTRNDWDAFSKLWHERSPAFAVRRNILTVGCAF